MTKKPRFDSGAAVLPVVVVEILIASLGGMAATVEPGFREGGWFPAVWSWIFLVVLHGQLLMLRLPPKHGKVSADYRDSHAKRVAYASILVLSIAMIVVFAIIVGWPVALSGAAAVLGVAGFLDLLGRDAVKFENAKSYAAKARIAALAEIDERDLERYTRGVDRFGIPHVNGVFGPALTALVSLLLGLSMYFAGRYLPRSNAGSGESLSVFNWATIGIAVLSVLLLLLSWISPRFQIGMTSFLDGLSDKASARMRELQEKVSSVWGEVRRCRRTMTASRGVLDRRSPPSRDGNPAPDPGDEALLEQEVQQHDRQRHDVPSVGSEPLRDRGVHDQAGEATGDSCAPTSDHPRL